MHRFVLNRFSAKHVINQLSAINKQLIARAITTGVMTALSDLLREMPFKNIPTKKYTVITQIPLLATFSLITLIIPALLSMIITKTVYSAIDIALPMRNLVGSTS